MREKMDQKQKTAKEQMLSKEGQITSQQKSKPKLEKEKSMTDVDGREGGAKVLEGGVQCSACQKKLNKGSFSKNQLTKVKNGEKGRCKQCIAASK